MSGSIRSRNVTAYKPPGNRAVDPYADAFTLLAEVLALSARLPGAACASQPDLFNPGVDAVQRRLAVGICTTKCPCLTECRAWAATVPPGHVSGTVAGQYRPPPHHPRKVRNHVDG